MRFNISVVCVGDGDGMNLEENQVFFTVCCILEQQNVV